jgi:hypothetical protein
MLMGSVKTYILVLGLFGFVALLVCLGLVLIWDLLLVGQSLPSLSKHLADIACGEC